jgi:hypothetical protein
MFRRSKTEAMRERTDAGAALAAELARDKRFRRALIAALGHGAAAGEQARSRIGPVATVNRLVADPDLRAELSALSKNLQQAKRRLDRKRSHKLRNALLMTSAAAAVVATPPTRRRLTELVTKLGTRAPAYGGTDVAETDADSDTPISRQREPSSRTRSLAGQTSGNAVEEG